MKITKVLTVGDQRIGMAGDYAANGFAFEGWMAPISSGITSELGVRCCGRHLVAKVAIDCGLSAWQLVAGAAQLLLVEFAESVDGEAADCLVGTFHYKGTI